MSKVHECCDATHVGLFEAAKKLVDSNKAVIKLTKLLKAESPQAHELVETYYSRPLAIVQARHKLISEIQIALDASKSNCIRDMIDLEMELEEFI